MSGWSPLAIQSSAPAGAQTNILEHNVLCVSSLCIASQSSITTRWPSWHCSTSEFSLHKYPKCSILPQALPESHAVSPSLHTCPSPHETGSLKLPSKHVINALFIHKALPCSRIWPVSPSVHPRGTHIFVPSSSTHTPTSHLWISTFGYAQTTRKSPSHRLLPKCSLKTDPLELV